MVTYYAQFNCQKGLTKSFKVSPGDIWATSWKNLLCHVRATKMQISLRIRAVWSASLLFAPWIVQFLYILYTKVQLLLDSVAEQAGLSLTWSQTSEDRFSRDVAHFAFRNNAVMNLINTHPSFRSRLNEPPHDKTNKNDLCAQRRLRSAWASTQSDQSSGS